MPEVHLRKPIYTYSAWGPFIKSKEIIFKFNKTEDSQNIYENELDKLVIFKDLPSRTAFDKALRNKAFNIAKNPRYDRGLSTGLASMAYRFFNKEPVGVVKNEIIQSKELSEELQNRIIKQFEKEKYTHLL